MGKRSLVRFLEELAVSDFSSIPKKKLSRFQKMVKKKAKKNREIEKRHREYDGYEYYK